MGDVLITSTGDVLKTSVGEVPWSYMLDNMGRPQDVIFGRPQDVIFPCPEDVGRECPQEVRLDWNTLFCVGKIIEKK